MNSQTNSVADRHKRFNASRDTVFHLVKEAGFTPTSRKKVVKGYDNEVYEIETKESVSLIIRIRHFGDSSLKEEDWVINQYRKAGASVPHVYKTGTVNDTSGKNVISREYMIQAKIPGTPLSELKERLTPDQLTTVYRHAGIVLRLLHTVSVDGFYKYHSDTGWDFRDWNRFSQINIDDRTTESFLIMQSGFSQKEVDRMISYLEYYRDNFSCTSPVLCHGDYLEEHIFVNDDLSVSGVIDFGMYRGDHPIFDFARLYMDSRFSQMNILKKGYGKHEMFDMSFDMRLLLHALSNQMGHVAYYTKEKMTKEMLTASKRLRETLKKLEQYKVL